MDRISIIGAGVVGTTVAILARRAGYEIAAIASRRMESARRASERLGEDVAVGDACEAARCADVVLITTRDDAIESVCRQVAEAGAFRAGVVVGHCSGALGSEVLESARQRCGAVVGSIHPMQTFPSVDHGLEQFPGTWCFCEGDDEAVATLGRVFGGMGARVERIETSLKPLYHATSVMACNYLVALMDAASELAEQAGIDRRRSLEAMEHMVMAAIRNTVRSGPAEALTGPIERGDVETVRRHLEAIEGYSQDIVELYRVLGRRVLGIARGKGKLPPAVTEQLRKMLDGR